MINNYYIIENGQQTGPFSHIELMDKGLSCNTLVLSPITNEWGNAATLFEFSDYFKSQGIYYPSRAILATFWWRLLAYLIDYALWLIFFGAIGGFIGLLSLYLGTNQLDSEPDKPSDLLTNLLVLILFLAYNSFFESTVLQGSIGKIICKLKVVDAEGGRINFSRSLKRNLGKFFSGIVIGMGYLNILWNDNRQGWHDEIAKTFVIRHT